MRFLFLGRISFNTSSSSSHHAPSTTSQTSAFRCLFAHTAFLFATFVGAIVHVRIIFFSGFFLIAVVIFIAAGFFLWLTLRESFFIFI